MFVRGDLKQCQDEADRQYRLYQPSSPTWAGRFRALEAEAALWRGMYDEVLKLLAPPAESHSHPDTAILMLTLKGVADAHLNRFDQAEQSLQEAERLCSLALDASCGGVVSRARGVLALQRRRLPEARRYFEHSLSFARLHGDRFLEATALLNLGDMSIWEEHFDQAVDQSEEAYRAATNLGAGDIALVAAGNLGWAFYKLGDSDRALQLFLEAEKRADELGDIVDQAAFLTDAGYVYMDSHNAPLAEESFRLALELERRVNSKEDIYNALRVLARLSLQTDDLEKASAYAGQALDIARQSGNRLDQLYPLLVQGQIAARRGHTAAAEIKFREVEGDESCPVFLKWEAEHSLAQLYEGGNRPEAADREYRAALETFEAARDNVRHEDFHLSFLTNAARIYDDYVHFLVVQGKTNEALRWADYNRARTLAEGLGLLSKRSSVGPPPLNAQEIAQRLKGTILFYWLGDKQSYVWAITPQSTSLFPLPAAPEVDAAVQGYRKALGGPLDVLESADQDGRLLYRTLIAPAQALLPKEGKVFIIPDGPLNNLNFETLLVSEPKRHYWIEDGTIVNASSLRVLAASYATENRPARNLLLIGNSVAPNPKYPELPKASVQVESVAGNFPASGRQILTREQATPRAYLASKPEQFSYIHFVAHGTASRLSPLDSAIVLSKGSAQDDSFKLYARDIIRRPLRADLVTISACYGADGRSYSGEGLVGLSWAFLKAGAHNVIAALWEVSDASTPLLMDQMYEEIGKGKRPEEALRTAKLSLLHSDNAFRRPFYWAPFQFYTGSRAERDQHPGLAFAR